jgi:DNA-directed RNA polymerase specialized sigma24 family protein
MTRTDKELERAAEHAMNFDPENARPIDLRGLREISEATEAIRAYEAKQREAVALARAHGISWNLIAGALGVSRQAARQRFAGAAPAITARGITVPKTLIVSASAVPKLSGRTGGRSARKAAKRKTGR